MLSTIAPHLLHLHAGEPAGCWETMSIARRFASVLASAFDESCLFKEDCSFDNVFDDLKMRNMISPRDSQSEKRRHARRGDQWNTLSHRCERCAIEMAANGVSALQSLSILDAQLFQVMIFSGHLPILSFAG